jgi:hypothetical protein
MPTRSVAGGERKWLAGVQPAANFSDISQRAKIDHLKYRGIVDQDQRDGSSADLIVVGKAPTH